MKWQKNIVSGVGSFLLLVAVMFVPSFAVASESLDAYYDTGDDAYWGVDSTQAIAQTFLMQGTGDVPYVDVLIEDATGTGVVRWSIRATTGGVPSGADLGYVDVNEASIPATPDWYRLTFNSPISLVSGTTYAIVAVYQSGTNYWGNWRVDSTSPSYADGKVFADYAGPAAGTGVNWGSGFTTDDFMFRVYKTDTIIPSSSSWDYAATSTDAIILLPVAFGFLFFFILGFWIIIIRFL